MPNKKAEALCNHERNVRSSCNCDMQPRASVETKIMRTFLPSTCTVSTFRTKNKTCISPKLLIATYGVDLSCFETKTLKNRKDQH